MKKAFATLIALVLVLAMVGTAFAVNTYSITIDNANNGETYTAYKIFDVTYSGNNGTPGTDPGEPEADPTHLHTAYSYTISDSSPWFTFFNGNSTADTNGVYTNSTYGLKFTPHSADPHTYTVEPTATGGYDGTKAAALAAAIRAEIDRAETAAAATPPTANPYTVAGTGTGASGTATIDVNPDVAGYYFVTTTTGSLCSLDTTEPTATIREKNTTSSASKQVYEDQISDYGDKNDAELGETVYYKTQVTIGAHQSTVVLHDTLHNGLKLCAESGITVKVGDTALAATNYTLTRTDDNNFTIAFTDAYTEALAADTVVTVEYTAEVLTNAALDVPATATVGNGNDNETWVTYGAAQTQSTHDWTRTYVWSFPIFKYTGTNTPLADANFSLYRFADQTNPMQFVLVSTGDTTNATVYRLATSADNAASKVTELVTPASGLITIQGVDSDKFILKENEAPAGYNKLADDITVEIVAIANTNAQGNTVNGAQAGNASKTLMQGTDTVTQVSVVNNTGNELPATGGIGTTIFYVLGGLLVAGAVVVLFVRKRMSEQA